MNTNESGNFALMDFADISLDTNSEYIVTDTGVSVMVNGLEERIKAFLGSDAVDYVDVYAILDPARNALSYFETIAVYCDGRSWSMNFGPGEISYKRTEVYQKLLQDDKDGGLAEALREALESVGEEHEE